VAAPAEIASSHAFNLQRLVRSINVAHEFDCLAREPAAVNVLNRSDSSLNFFGAKNAEFFLRQPAKVGAFNFICCLIQLVFIASQRLMTASKPTPNALNFNHPRYLQNASPHPQNNSSDVPSPYFLD